jgi:hypothetical protein
MTKKKHNPDDKPLEFGYTIEFEFDDFGATKRVKVQAEPHEQAAVNSAIHTAITSNIHGRPSTQPPTTPEPARESAPKLSYGTTAPLFNAVIDDFLNKYQQGKKPAMFKKHRPVLAMLLEVVGNKAIDSLRQSDINEFFELLVHQHVSCET